MALQVALCLLLVQYTGLISADLSDGGLRRFVLGAVDGSWSTWKQWGSCSITCGGGTRTRRRVCVYPPHVPQGAYCSGSGSETVSCNTMLCPVNGHWTDWVRGSCSVSCGVGTWTRRRTCTYPPNAPHGYSCFGSASEVTSCNSGMCPVDGSWSEWEKWPRGSCSVTCGNGTWTRRRTCTYPPNAPRGDRCYGSASDVASCNNGECPVDGSWSEWEKWPRGSCSVTCGGGTWTRRRTCTFPSAMPRGLNCTGPASEIASCGTGVCPVDGLWSTWKEWGSCTATCGGGTHIRRRTCEYPPHVPQGTYCAGSGTDRGSCNTNSCRV